MTHANEIHSAAAKAAAEYLAGWQRSRAELDNFRKRMHAGQGQLQAQHQRALIEPILSLNDNFRAMIEHVPAELQQHAWVKGAVHIARQLNDILAEFNVTTIEPRGSAFDPRLHEAIAHVTEANVPSGTIVEVVQAGYQLNETVLRPAKVKVAA